MYICTGFDEPSGGIFSFPAMDSPAPYRKTLSLMEDFKEQKGNYYPESQTFVAKISRIVPKGRHVAAPQSPLQSNIHSVYMS